MRMLFVGLIHHENYLNERNLKRNITIWFLPRDISIIVLLASANLSHSVRSRSEEQEPSSSSTRYLSSQHEERRAETQRVILY